MLDFAVRGTIVTALGTLEDGHLGISGGKVVYVGAEHPDCDEITDHGGKIVFPGAVDAQVHSRSQKGREGFTYSSKAAAAGGVTTMVDMPYDEGLLVCNAEAVKKKADDVARQSHVDVALYGTIHPDDGTSRIDEQVAAGVCAFKFSTFGTHPVRFPRIPPQLMSEAFAEIARHGLTAGVHNENEEIVNARKEVIKASGRTDYLTHGETHTPLSELLAMVEIYEIGAYTGCPAHVVHCSLGRGIEICENYRRQGYDATVEVCLHYFLFDEDTTVRERSGLAKGNPPLRPAAEKEKLWAHLIAGNIDLVSTDHVAWSLDRKNNPNMLLNSSGGPGLEVLVTAFIGACIDRDVDLSIAARVLAGNPARHFRLAEKGALTIGCDADFSVIDPVRTPWLVANSQTVSDWSNYDGMDLPRITETWLRGEKIWDGQTVLNAEGDGRFVKPYRG